MPNSKWQPPVGQTSIPSYFSQSNLIRSNLKVIKFGRIILKIIAKYNITPKYVFNQLTLGCPILTLDIFLISCRTRLGLSKQCFQNKDLRDTFALINNSKTTINVGEFTSFLILIQKLDEKRKSNVASLLTSETCLIHNNGNISSSFASSSSSSTQSKHHISSNISSKITQTGSNVAINENLVLDFRYSIHGVQVFTIPFYGTWRILARAAHGGDFAMQEGGHPAECCVSISCLIPGQTFIIGVGEEGHLGGGGGATFVALLDKGVSIYDHDKTARLLLIMGGGGGAGFRDGVEASCHKKGEAGLNEEVENPLMIMRNSSEDQQQHHEQAKQKEEKNEDTKQENDEKKETKEKKKGGSRGRGLRYESLKDGSKQCLISSIHRFASKVRYGGRMGGGDAATAFSLSSANTGPVTDPNDFTFLAGGGGGGGYKGGEGGAFAGGGGGSFIDRSIMKVEFFRISTQKKKRNIVDDGGNGGGGGGGDDGTNIGNGLVELSISERIYKGTETLSS